MIQHSEKLDALGAALAKAQAAVKGAKKDANNPFFKSSYADLASVWEACREALTSNGLSVVQFPGFENGIATLDTMLLHSSGQWISATAGTPLTKNDPQGVGSALTYLRRYALAAVASVSPEDDDGQAASGAKRNTSRGGVAPSPVTAAGTGAQGSPVAPTAPAVPTWNGKPLTEYPTDDLTKLRAVCVKKGVEKYGKSIEQIDEVLTARQGE